jgi:hypothetical protein
MSKQMQKVLEKWVMRLYDSHEICPYCRETKKDYVCPETGLLTPLKCECEKALEMYKDAREGILQAQYNIKSKVDFNEHKLSNDDKIYMIDSEKKLERINLIIRNYDSLKLN